MGASIGNMSTIRPLPPRAPDPEPIVVLRMPYGAAVINLRHLVSARFERNNDGCLWAHYSLATQLKEVVLSGPPAEQLLAALGLDPEDAHTHS